MSQRAERAANYSTRRNEFLQQQTIIERRFNFDDKEKASKAGKKGRDNDCDKKVNRQFGPKVRDYPNTKDSILKNIIKRENKDKKTKKQQEILKRKKLKKEVQQKKSYEQCLRMNKKLIEMRENWIFATENKVKCDMADIEVNDDEYDICECGMNNACDPKKSIGKRCDHAMKRKECNNNNCGGSHELCGNRRITNGITTTVIINDKGKGFYGLFATQEIYVGDFVCEYIGNIIDEKMKDEISNHNYCMELVPDKIFIDAFEYCGPAAMINHACTPLCNCEIQIWTVHKQKRAVIVSLMDIGIGNEITIDYSEKGSYSLKDFECEKKNCKRHM